MKTLGHIPPIQDFFCFFECCELHGTLRNAISVVVSLALPACVRPDVRGLRAQKNTNKT